VIARNAFWPGKSVLVTGAGGFVGSWLADELQTLGARVTVILRDHPAASNFKLLGLGDRVDVVDGSITDQALIERALGEYGIDTCFHLAAQAIVGVANRDPLSTFDSNVRGTWTVLEACRSRPDVRRVVVASSDKAYGDHPALPYVEEMELLGSNPYDASKACTEIIARSYHANFGLPLAVARCANVYGGGDRNYSRLIPGTIRSALGRRQPVIRSDGTPIRDYVYIDDAVSAYLTLAERLNEPSVAGEAFNFGGDEPVSVLDLTRRILDLCGAAGLDPEVLGVGPGPGEIANQYMSIAKAGRILGWSPQCPLDAGLAGTIHWYAEHLSLGAEAFATAG
jgi:CDP-glucose 4,6-dehydratase